VFPRFQYGTGANHLQPFVLAHHLPALYLRATLQAAADLALDEGLRLTVVGWHGSLGGVYVCKDGCAEGQHGTYTVLSDLDYIEAKANEEEFDGPTLALPRADGRTAVVLCGDAETKRLW
jgi:hypothetical protein